VHPEKRLIAKRLDWRKGRADASDEMNKKGYAVPTEESEQDIRDGEIDLCFPRYNYNDLMPVAMIKTNPRGIAMWTHRWQKRYAGERWAISAKSRRHSTSKQ